MTRAILLALTVLVVYLFVCTGCQSAVKTINDADMQQLRELVASAEQAGLSGNMQIQLGRPAVFAETTWGLDLGVKVTMNIQINPHEAP